MISILIVEDQPQQCTFLKAILEELGPDYRISSTSTIKESLILIHQYKFDLFLLDIGLPDGSGLDLAKEIRNIPMYELTWIVFLTTYTQYILEAFRRTHCYDYIIKPYKKEKVLELSKKLTQKSTTTSSTEESFLMFKLQGVVLKIHTNDILFVEVFKKNCTIHTHRQKYVIKRTPLKKIFTMLPSHGFIQCHRSYIINLSHIERIQKVDTSWEVSFMEYTDKAYVGETFYETVLNRLNQKQ